MLWVLHDYIRATADTVFGVMCVLLSEQQFVQKNLLSTLGIVHGNVWGGGKVLPFPVCLPTPQLGVVTILTDTGYVFLCRPVKSKAVDSLALR